MANDLGIVNLQNYGSLKKIPNKTRMKFDVKNTQKVESSKPLKF